MANNFFKHGDKGYVENLNDGILVGNAFDWTLEVSLPDDTGSVFPASSDVVKGKVCDLSITPNSNLSIGSTISNSSGSSQVYRLTVYPDFNRFGGFQSISLEADSGVTFYIANKGGSTPIANNLDYDDLGNVPELKVLKEYDIVITVPNGKSVSGLSFVLQSSSADVYGSIAQSNVTGLSDSFALKVNVADIRNNLTSTDTNKPLSANMGKSLKDSLDSHNHDSRYYTESEIDDKFGWVEVSTLSGDFSYADTETTAKLEVNPTLRLGHLTFKNNHNYQNGANLYTIGIGFPSDTYRPLREIFVPCHNSGKYLCIIPSKEDDFPMCQMRKDTSYNGTVTTYVDVIYKY